MAERGGGTQGQYAEENGRKDGETLSFAGTLAFFHLPPRGDDADGEHPHFCAFGEGSRRKSDSGLLPLRERVGRASRDLLVSGEGRKRGERGPERKREMSKRVVRGSEGGSVRSTSGKRRTGKRK